MLEIVKSGGWLMLPIILCSVIAAAIIIERLWTLQPRRVLPRNLTRQVWEWVSKNQLNHAHIQSLHQGSPLGEILAAGLVNRHREREIIKESIEDAGRQVVHDLERFLNSLGTIAAIIAAARTARHGDRHGQGVRGHYDPRRRRSDGAGRRDFRGADHDRGRPDRRDSVADRVPVSAAAG